MKVSVVIPAYNEEEYLGTCLVSLMDQTEKPDEIIVVDNNSTDKTAEIAKRFGVKIVRETVQGITPARNAGFNSAQYEIIARTDADSRVPKNWIQRIKKQFEDPNLIAYSGPVVYQDKRFNRFFAFPEKFMLLGFKKVIGHDCLYGPNMALRQSAWEKVKDVTCSNDKAVHEDFDVSIHLGELHDGNIVFDPRFTVEVSERRWKKITPYLEYPYRYFRTLQRHKQSLHGIKRGVKLIGKVARTPKRLLHFVSARGGQAQ